ncbi:MAG: hypothetical protein ABFC96_04970 [Thermoguttaceae bacterium]
MAARERWIVYPLLFLALGAILRERFVGVRTLSAESLECQALVIRGPNGRPVVEAGTDATTNSGAIYTFSPQGVPLVQIDRLRSGGAIILTGQRGGEFGVFVRTPEDRRIAPIAVAPVWWHTPDGRFPPKDQPKAAKPAAAPASKPATKQGPAAGAPSGRNQQKKGK